ncbi:MAG: universal stress protein, partial [Brachybacterium sp.]|nr:universal stress protein [Brachybacterium sp.]
MGFTGQNIVVGYDDTTAAMAAVRWAGDLARSTESTLRLVHAWTWPLLGQGMTGIPVLDPTGPRNQAMRLLDDAAERVAAQFPEVPVTAELLSGTPRE